MPEVTLLPEFVTDDALHKVLLDLNEMAEALGSSTVPYTRTARGHHLNVPSLQETLTIALELLNSDAEEEPVTPHLHGYVPTTGGASGGLYSATWRPAAPPRQAKTVAQQVAAQPSTSNHTVSPLSNIMFTPAKYVGFTADLLADVNVQTKASVSSPIQFQLITAYIKIHGYDPSNFSFDIQNVKDDHNAGITLGEVKDKFGPTPNTWRLVSIPLIQPVIPQPVIP